MTSHTCKEIEVVCPANIDLLKYSYQISELLCPDLKGYSTLESNISFLISNDILTEDMCGFLHIFPKQSTYLLLTRL